MTKVAVVGSGSWGTTIARHLGNLGNQVCMWAHSEQVAAGIRDSHRNPRYLTDIELPQTLTATSDLAESLSGAEAVVMVTPSVNLREVCREAASTIGDDVPVVVLTKGIEPDTSSLMIDVVAQEIGHPERTACLSGPNLAAEIAHDLPAATVVAARTERTGRFLQGLFHSDMLRTYLSSDVIGVEVCGAVKNIVAIACGISHGLENGENTAAMLMTRGLAEMGRLVSALGGNPLTCQGLAGMGDLVATCSSPRSRNFSFGVSFSQGETLEQYRARTHMVVEGYYACQSVHRMTKELGVESPLTDAVYALLHQGKSLASVKAQLLSRHPRTELYGIRTDGIE